LFIADVRAVPLGRQLIFFISTTAVRSIIRRKRMRQSALYLEISRGRRNAEKHFHKETHRLAAAGNIGRSATVPPQDNVNIQLGFVIGNYFSLLRSLFSDVIPATVLARIPRRILECGCSCALYAITSKLSRRRSRRLVSLAAWNFS